MLMIYRNYSRQSIFFLLFCLDILSVNGSRLKREREREILHLSEGNLGRVNPVYICITLLNVLCYRKPGSNASGVTLLIDEI